MGFDTYIYFFLIYDVKHTQKIFKHNNVTEYKRITSLLSRKNSHSFKNNNLEDQQS